MLWSSEDLAPEQAWGRNRIGVIYSSEWFLSADVEEMSRGPHCRLVGTHFEEQVEPQIASGRLELVVALIVG